MDDTKISITVTKGFVERLFYWIIIIVLAALLIWQVLKDDCTTQDTTVTDSQDTQTDTSTVVPAEEAVTPPPVAAASCADGEKNQDETDIDCGGSCTKCATGSTCKANTDCISSICYNSTCVTEKPVVLSGKVELDLTKVTTTTAATGAKKVTAVSYTIKNGMPDDFAAYRARIYLKKLAGDTRCYNQQTPSSCDDAYADFEIKGVKSGQTRTEEHVIAAGEYTSGVGNYVVDDVKANPTSFYVVMYLYDENGNEINEKSIIDSYQIK